MSEQLKHIFDISKCPTKRQIQDYLRGSMEPEEVYAFEHHISSCLLCSEALDGVTEHKEAALAGMTDLNNNFLKDHLELHPPHIHLNGLAAATLTPQNLKNRKNNPLAIWKPVGIAATLLLCLGIGWYFKNTWNAIDASPIARQTATASEKEVATDLPPAAQLQSIAQPQAAKGSNREPVNDSEKASLPRVVLLADVKQENETAAGFPKPATAKVPADTHGYLPDNSRQLLTGKEDTSPSSASLKKETAKVALLSTRMAEENADADAIMEKNADDLYKDGQYTEALTAYKKLINSGDAGVSQYARLMAARCHLNLDQKKNAEKLLSDLAGNGSGYEKREAKKLLRKLRDEMEK